MLETVARTAFTRLFGAVSPTRKYRQTLSGSLNAKRAGARINAMRLTTSRRGGETNPAQSTKARNPLGASAANLTAKGVENDSAKMTEAASRSRRTTPRSHPYPAKG